MSPGRRDTLRLSQKAKTGLNTSHIKLEKQGTLTGKTSVTIGSRKMSKIAEETPSELSTTEMIENMKRAYSKGTPIGPIIKKFNEV